MCSRLLNRHRQDSMKSLLTMFVIEGQCFHLRQIQCVEHLLAHIDSYSNNFPYLPIQIKNRILKRLTSIKVNFPNITEIYGMLVHSQLKRIDFSLNEVDDKMLNILSQCCNMRELILTRNKNDVLTEKALIDIVPKFNKLVILQTQNCFALSDEVVKIIVENCPNLSEIDLAGCRNISDLTLLELSKLSALTALNISRTKITDKGIKYLVEGKSSSIIKELRLSECLLVTHVAINLICEKCKSLEMFIFNNCANENGQTEVFFDNENLTKLKQLTWTVYW